MTTWTQIRLLTASENADACAQLLLDAGCDGVQIDDSAVLRDESEDAPIVPKAEATVTGYLTAEDKVRQARIQLENVIQRNGITAHLVIEPLPEEDWSTTWRENFPPLCIGAFLIVPSWEEDNVPVDPNDNAVIIRLDPGLAFGTGQHPTTRMCLELVSEYLKAGVTANHGAPTLLDVGCGSGILSIAAAKLGARVTASDLDKFCVAATQENATANHASMQVVQAAGLDWIKAPFDFVVANLTSAVLISLADQLAQVTRPGGTLIISGISAPRALDVQTAFHQQGFQTVEQRALDGEQRGDFTERWAAFVMQQAK